MALAFEKRLAPSGTYPEEAERHEENRKLDILVVFTSVAATLRALRCAADLACQRETRIALLVLQAVPFPLPLESPPVLLSFNEQRFLTIARESHVDTTVRIFLCRDRWETLSQILRVRSLIVLGGRKRWWPTAEERLAKRLRGIGHEVVFVETE